jgi:NAD(P)-dependent dehydrogenase (short-subunit alcohol dehydrogenase family)
MGMLDGKVALVTGAGGGLGRAHALLLAKEGASVVVNDLGGARDGTGAGHNMADQVVAEIKAAGGKAVADYGSVADPAQAKAMVQTAVKTFGKIDICINNAGILRDKSLVNTTEDMFDIVVQVHLKGTYCVTRPAFTHMKERGQGGVIINTSSTSGLNGNFGQSNYGAAKAGIWGFTRCVALEGKKNKIRCYALAPVALTRLTGDLGGFQDPKMQERMNPRLVSPLVVFLASELAAELTDKTFFVGGGRIAEMRMVTAPGVQKTDNGGLWTAEEIAARINEILLPA